jgi:hypothetical protein
MGEAMNERNRWPNQNPYWPKYLTPRPYDPHEHEDWLRRAAYAYPSIVKYQEQDRPLKVNYGYGEQVFTLEDCLVWMERRADAVLG